MPCDCCSPTLCCVGPNCETKTKSQCASEGTRTFSCASATCIDSAGKQSCTQENICSCQHKGKSYLGGRTTCNCNDLSNVAVRGGCRWFYCERCNSATGQCISTCPSPQECCPNALTANSVCCPIHQRCTSSACVDKCSSGTTFCQGTGSAFTCCPANQKCCGSQGCRPRSTTSATVTVTINVGQDAWVDTGVSIPSDTTVIITATGGASGAGANAPIGSGPDGAAGAQCDEVQECKVMGAECLLRLIGEVGGAPFGVGANYSGKPGSGALRLRANNTCADRFAGSYTASVTYVTNDPCPDFTPASVGEPVVYEAGQIASGPGTELKLLLKLGGIVASPTCSCNARAAQMDVWGEWECLTRLREICGWLREEAEKRDLWFFAPAGMVLISAAIALSALKRPFRGNSK